MYCETTQLSCDKVIKGIDRQTNLEQIRENVRKNLQEAGKARQFKFNQKFRLIQFHLGDLVKIRRLNKSDASQKKTKKFVILYEGPYVIAVIPYPNVYIILVDPKTNKVRGKFDTIFIYLVIMQKTRNVSNTGIEAEYCSMRST